MSYSSPLESQYTKIWRRKIAFFMKAMCNPLFWFKSIYDNWFFIYSYCINSQRNKCLMSKMLETSYGLPFFKDSHTGSLLFSTIWQHHVYSVAAWLYYTFIWYGLDFLLYYALLYLLKIKWLGTICYCSIYYDILWDLRYM